MEKSEEEYEYEEPHGEDGDDDASALSEPGESDEEEKKTIRPCLRMLDLTMLKRLKT